MSLENVVKGFVRIFGSRNERVVRRLRPLVDAMNRAGEDLKSLTDAELRGRTDVFRERLARGETLDDILVEAFAVVREMSSRTPAPGAEKGLRHFDVQLMGGIVLHRGCISEMMTGEGKTLVATLPAYLNALAGKGVHIVTVNDYLAQRDRDWMGPIYERLGLTTGVIRADMGNAERMDAYRADITYGTNNEFGFDYLRDNMKMSLEDLVQRPLHYAIVDEVDSILIDEARTPLIISGMSEGATDKYYRADAVARRLTKGVDFEIKEKENQAILTEEGIVKAQKLVGVESFYGDARYMDWPHLLEQSLRAHHLFKADVDYIVDTAEDGGKEIIIIDEFTGRLMRGRRWSDGLHQAVEAKERIRIRAESQTLATITLQNYFRLYRKLAGMTGTAITEAGEFLKIYKLDVVSIPTHRTCVRKDLDDVIFATEKEKYNAIADEIVANWKEARPMLVGTTSVEKSEKLAEMLQRRGVPHEVLNAKQHRREAEIIANAGFQGHVTIATNMAGRGTDIVLGPGVVGLGGLYVIGTERHEARRIDNQLRGRSGRQGDPGMTRFYLCLEDDLMRRFASDTVGGILRRLGLRDGQAIEHRWVTRAIERAQKKVEARNFEIRKSLLEYDEVMNEQRTMVYSNRQAILRGEGLREMVERMIHEVVDQKLSVFCDGALPPAEWDLDELGEWVRRKAGVAISFEGVPRVREDLEGRILDELRKLYDAREAAVTPDLMRRIEGYLLLSAFDVKWKEHLYNMDVLKSGIGLRAQGGQDPKIEYKREGYSLFSEMIRAIQEEVTDLVFKVRINVEPVETRNVWQGASETHEQLAAFDQNRASTDAAIRQSQSKEPPKPFVHAGPRAGRNDPCPCGSGRKYKKCHGIVPA